jgi:hypothetical protein
VWLPPFHGSVAVSSNFCGGRIAPTRDVYRHAMLRRLPKAKFGRVTGQESDGLKVVFVGLGSTYGGNGFTQEIVALYHGPKLTPKQTNAEPVKMSVSHMPGHDIWAFRGQVFATSEALTADDVRALVLESENKNKMKLARAHALMQQVAVLEGPRRQPIPDDVKMFVWQRDHGQCVRCGSNLNLEFDHIIPVTMGGANTARNLQLLCEGCNRAKGGSLV